MPRPPRLDYRDARHHVMNRGARKAPIFFDHECCGLFRGLLSKLPGRFNVIVHGYTLMPNHVHLLVQTPSANLSHAMRFLFGSYARELNRTHEWDGPLFKGRFKNKVVEQSEYWMHLLAYIHLNQVRAGYVARLDESDWTSHAAYVGLERAPEWLYRDEMMELYGTPEAYLDYLKDQQVGRGTTPEGFVRAVLWKQRSPNRPKQPESTDEPRSEEDRFDHAMATLRSVTGLSADELIQARRGRTGNRARWVTTWWLRYGDVLAGTEVAARLGVSTSRVSHLLKQARNAEDTDEQLASWMGQLRER